MPTAPATKPNAAAFAKKMTTLSTVRIIPELDFCDLGLDPGFLSGVAPCCDEFRCSLGAFSGFRLAPGSLFAPVSVSAFSVSGLTVLRIEPSRSTGLSPPAAFFGSGLVASSLSDTIMIPENILRTIDVKNPAEFINRIHCGPNLPCTPRGCRISGQRSFALSKGGLAFVIECNA